MISPLVLFEMHEWIAADTIKRGYLTVTHPKALQSLSIAPTGQRDLSARLPPYMPSARRLNPNCNFFGVTAEINPARLKKVVMQTEPVARHAAITRLVHVHRPHATSVIGHDAELANLMNLANWVRDSKNWR